MYLDEMLGPAVQQHLRLRAGDGLSLVLAAALQPAARDSAHLAYAAQQGLSLVTRNVQDFLWLHERWVTLRDWGILSRPHAGIVLGLGPVSDSELAERVMELLLHPLCPPLEDQLVLWHAAASRWESDHPYAARRRRPVPL
jgi:hypothetical protein